MSELPDNGTHTCHENCERCKTPIISKSEMKRIATLDPQRAADELERLKRRISELEHDLESARMKANELGDELQRVKSAIERRLKSDETIMTPKCLVCFSLNPDRAHIKTKGSGGSFDDWNIMLLCRFCHQEQHKIGIITFIEKYDSVKTYVESKGWEIVSINNFKRLIRKPTS